MSLPGTEPFSEDLQKILRAAYHAKGKHYKPRSKYLHADGSPQYSNRLLLENSPYLLQHAHNPVNWFAWSETAFAEAERLQRPVFASFGYSTCHWCHVMEEESFDNSEVAEYLNRYFIAIKVDREARPDLDAIYMRAVQMMTGQGGWPLNVWLFPDQQVFYGGTYFPPENRYGRPGFTTVLQAIVDAYGKQATSLRAQAERLSDAIGKDLSAVYRQTGAVLDRGPLDAATDFYRQHIDSEWGGIGDGVKFPSNVPVRLLLRRHGQQPDADLLAKVDLTLAKMADGGIYDHLGGGFHRYSTDAQWLVPHFEKMLYDNAQLPLAYLEAYQLTGNMRYRQVATETLDYVLREMTAPEGGFFSATDADSVNSAGEAEEGWYFTWTPEEVAQALPADVAALVCQWFQITPAGHLHGRTVLHTWCSRDQFAATKEISAAELVATLQHAQQRLLAVREQRPAPLRDDKIIASWNGLMLAAFAKAAWLLRRPDYLQAARQAADFILTHMRQHGRLARLYLHGAVQGPALLTDYAFLVNGLLELYQADGQAEWLRQALALQELQERLYLDAADGVYCRTAIDGEKLLCREKPFEDGVMPSGNAMTALNLLRLAKLTGDNAFHAAALRLLRAFAARLREQPLAMTDMLLALDFELAAGREIVLIEAAGSDNSVGMREVLRQYARPHDVWIIVKEGQQYDENAACTDLLRGRTVIGGKTTGYVCRNQACALPANTPEDFQAQLQA